MGRLVIAFTYTTVTVEQDIQTQEYAVKVQELGLQMATYCLREATFVTMELNLAVQAKEFMHSVEDCLRSCNDTHEWHQCHLLWGQHCLPRQE